MSYRFLKVIVTLAAFAGTLITVGSARAQQSSDNEARRAEEQKYRENRSLKAVAKQAKQQGKQQVNLPAPIWMRLDLDTFDQYLAASSVVVADLVHKECFAKGRDMDEVVTWYKFRVEEILFRPPSFTGPLPLGVPGGLLPLAPNEILVEVNGGNLKVDDVEILSRGNLSSLAKGKQYELFVSFDSSGKVASIQSGADGVFEIKPDGTLVSHLPHTGTIRTAIEDVYHSSLADLRNDLRVRSSR